LHCSGRGSFGQAPSHGQFCCRTLHLQKATGHSGGAGVCVAYVRCRITARLSEILDGGPGAVVHAVVSLLDGGCGTGDGCDSSRGDPLDKGPSRRARGKPECMQWRTSLRCYECRTGSVVGNLGSDGMQACKNLHDGAGASRRGIMLGGSCMEAVGGRDQQGIMLCARCELKGDSRELELRCDDGHPRLPVSLNAGGAWGVSFLLWRALGG
jgi:hypothetical protein